MISQKSQISAFAFSSEKSMLASGSADCSIVLWDIVGESPICKLKGHKNEIVGLAFATLETQIGSTEFLISAGKDGMVKVWDLSMNASIITIPSKSTEIWRMKFFEGSQTMAISTNNDEIHFFDFFPSKVNVSMIVFPALMIGIQAKRHIEKIFI